MGEFSEKAKDAGYWAGLIALGICVVLPGVIFIWIVVIGPMLGSFVPPWQQDDAVLIKHPDPQAPAEPDQSAIVISWSCFWDPTMNENWHDDVLCSNGSQLDRPILLPDWDFVTQEDMMAEAMNYENYLNGR